jgi:prefoldin subunit 5
MAGKTPTAKELHAAIEGLRKKAQQLRDELEQTNGKIAVLERAASDQAGDAPAGSGGTTAGQK